MGTLGNIGEFLGRIRSKDIPSETRKAVLDAARLGKVADIERALTQADLVTTKKLFALASTKEWGDLLGSAGQRLLLERLQTKASALEALVGQGAGAGVPAEAPVYDKTDKPVDSVVRKGGKPEAAADREPGKAAKPASPAPAPTPPPSKPKDGPGRGVRHHPDTRSATRSPESYGRAAY